MENHTQNIQKKGVCPTCGRETHLGKIHNDYREYPVEYCYNCDKYIHRDALGNEIQIK
jgi:hypothetical protein